MAERLPVLVRMSLRVVPIFPVPVRFTVDAVSVFAAESTIVPLEFKVIVPDVTVRLLPRVMLLPPVVAMLSILPVPAEKLFRVMPVSSLTKTFPPPVLAESVPVLVNMLASADVPMLPVPLVNATDVLPVTVPELWVILPAPSAVICTTSPVTLAPSAMLAALLVLVERVTLPFAAPIALLIFKVLPDLRVTAASPVVSAPMVMPWLVERLDIVKLPPLFVPAVYVILAETPG